MRRKNHENPISLSDILVKTLFVVFVLYILAALQASIEKQKKDSIEHKAEFVISTEWAVADDNNKLPDCDVDLWVRNPNGNVVWWQKKDGELMNLERDDIGNRNDSTVVNGVTIKDDTNKEYVFVRGIIPGEYTVNVHLFGCFSNTSISPWKLAKPISVKVVLTKLNPSYSEIRTEIVELTEIREEKTAFQFYVAADGSITRTDRIPTYFIKKTLEQQ